MQAYTPVYRKKCVSLGLPFASKHSAKCDDVSHMRHYYRAVRVIWKMLQESVFELM